MLQWTKVCAYFTVPSKDAVIQNLTLSYEQQNIKAGQTLMIYSPYSVCPVLYKASSRHIMYAHSHCSNYLTN